MAVFSSWLFFLHGRALRLIANLATNLTGNSATNTRKVRSNSGITIVQGMRLFLLVQAVLKECDDVCNLLVTAEQVAEVVALVAKEAQVKLSIR